MSKATKRSRPGRRLERKHEALFPLRRPAILATLGLCGWAHAVAADFPPTLDLSSLDGTNGFRLNGVAADDYSGRAVSSAGDVNGDGLADLLIGAPYADHNGAASGASYVVFGRNTAQTGPFPARLDLSDLDGTNGFRLNGVAAGDFSGRAVSSAGDVNGDGLADLLIGASRAGPNNVLSAGASYVVFGRNTAQTGPFPATLELSILDGTNGFRLNGVLAGGESGFALSSAGDVNGDGFADLLIGAYRAGPNGERSGASYVVFGRDTAENPFPASLDLSDLDGTNGFRLDGVAKDDLSGIAVSSAGDVNGDGLADLLIGARGAPNGSLFGASYVMFGRNTAQTGAFPATLDLSSLDGTNGFRLDGDEAGDHSGRAVSGAGDVNGDGLADLLIGAYRADPNGADSAGASYVVFGRNTAQDPFLPSLNVSDLDGTNGFHLAGVEAMDHSGRAVRGAGDVNGDGLADLLIGGDRADPNGDGSGASYVVFGRNTAQTGPFPASLDLLTLVGTNGFRLNGDEGGDRSGYAVSGAGDVNSDGLADLLIGAPGADPNGVNRSGASYVVFGEPPSSPPQPPPPQPQSPPPPPPPPPTGAPRTCNGLPVTIQGTDSGETLIGTSGNDVIDGRGGNDVIRGRGGNDVLCGGDGRDRLFGGPGRDRLFGGAGRDELVGDDGRDALNGGTGRDRCDGGAGADTTRRCDVRVRVP